MVFVRPIAGKKLVGAAGRHSLVTDRKASEGGTDAGCTSGELLLLAMATSGGGVNRIKLGSDIDAKCEPLESFPHPSSP